MRDLGDLLWGLVLPLVLLFVTAVLAVVLSQGWGLPVVLG
ncbi:hypothetical protein GCM10027174_20970 [Salinifilum aidingensis]